MNDPELIEYAVYHWTFGGDQNLPGLNHDGTIDAEFFTLIEELLPIMKTPQH